MTPKQELRHKKTSLAKWREMAKDLGLEQLKLDPPFDCEGCGYCLILLEPNMEGDRAAGLQCRGCVLDKPMLCHRGGGTAYENVRNYYNEGFDDSDLVLKETAQLSARFMVAVIERDVERTEAKLNQ